MSDFESNVTTFGFDSDPPTVANQKDAATNVVATVDVTSVAVDSPADGDYDDPYPGGPTVAPLLPTT